MYTAGTTIPGKSKAVAFLPSTNVSKPYVTVERDKLPPEKIVGSGVEL